MSPSALDLAEAHRLLRNPLEHPAIEVRAALQTVAAAAEYLLVGVCAETGETAQKALQEYLAALGEPIPELPPPLPQPGVYLKYNGRTGNVFQSEYQGRERSVILSCYSPNGGHEGLYGDLPLNLFARE